MLIPAAKCALPVLASSCFCASSISQLFFFLHAIVSCRLKAPTVSRLHGDAGYAIQIAAEASKVPHLVPKIREQGGSDIVVTSIRMLVA